MADYVFDSGAIIAALENEVGGTIVDAILNDQANTCFIHAVNVIEVYYHVLRQADQIAAEEALGYMANAGVIRVNEINLEMLRMVSTLKVVPGRVSLADCFGIALSLELDAEFVTTDRHEFDRLQALGTARFLFIR